MKEHNRESGHREKQGPCLATVLCVSVFLAITDIIYAADFLARVGVSTPTNVLLNHANLRMSHTCVTLDSSIAFPPGTAVSCSVTLVPGLLPSSVLCSSHSVCPCSSRGSATSQQAKMPCDRRGSTSCRKNPHL